VPAGDVPLRMVRKVGRSVSHVADASVLAMPEGWLFDQLGRDRLRRQLIAAESAVTAVVAERDELPPGSSHRVASERRALGPGSTLRLGRDLTVDGAAMVRAGVGFDVGDSFVEVDQGPVLIDQGAVVHNPWQPIGPPRDASPLGRPPDDRPVCVFLGLEPDPHLADWVRVVVNGLVARDVEARIAVPWPTGGLHLTRPCGPTEASVDALAPDVLVALDDTALELAGRWLGRRRIGLVRLTPDTTSEVTIQWRRRGPWRRRAEAAIGRGIDPGSMEALVHGIRPDVRRAGRRH
jgi:hypothetical protein